MNKNTKAFTLVELIVVITILAILGTIAFISLQGYSQDARDSVRISDISKIKTSLELFQLDAGKYPETTDATNITYSGAIAWTQGIFGNATFNNVTKLDKIPTDPVTDRKYVYSVTNTKQEYQIAGIMEGDEVTLNTNQPHPSPLLRGEGIEGILETNAAGKTAMLKISGNYNGKVLKVSTGGTDYVLAVPSIITSSGFALEQIVASKFLAYNGYKNLPAQYEGSSYDILGDNGINFVNSADLVIYSGDLKTLSSTELAGTTARKNLIEKLKSAYSGTAITNIGEIAQIVNVETGNIESIAGIIVSNNLGGSVSSIQMNNTLVCDEGKHTEDGLTCEDNIGVCEITNGAGINTWNGTKWECRVNTCDTDYYNPGDNTCIGVGIGYYSSSIDTTRTTCTNKPASNSTYTSNGNGTNNCSFTCDSGYVLNGNVCGLSQYNSCTASKQVITSTSIYPGCNAYDLIVCSGVGAGYTIAACNVGVGTAGTTSTSFGRYFQWGNNSGTSYGTRTISTTRVDVSSYGPTNYYSNSTFIGGTGLPSPYDWATTLKNDLWGDVTNTNEARKGPCATGYHIPTQAEWGGITNAGGWGASSNAMSEALRLPISTGHRYRKTGAMIDDAWGFYWASSAITNNGGNMVFVNGSSAPYNSGPRANSNLIRCFKN